MTSRLALLGLGSNLGDPDAQLREAVRLLAAAPGVRVLRVSAFVTTAPVGGPPQDDFRNAAVLVETELAATALLTVAEQVETALGRDRSGVRWGPRTIDVDLLLVGDEVVDTPRLSVPHPRFAERRFALEPAAEIAPDVVHPLLGRTVRELLEALP